MLNLHLDPFEDYDDSVEIKLYQASNPDQPVWSDLTNAHLPDVKIQVTPGDYKLSLVPRWYGGKSFASARVIRLPGKETHLTVPGRTSLLIADDVANVNGVGIPFVRVVAYTQDDPTEAVARFTTDERGSEARFRIGDGRKVRLIDATGRYRTQWAGGASSFRTADARPDDYDMSDKVGPLERLTFPGPLGGSSTITGLVHVPDLDHGRDLVHLYLAGDDTSAVASSGLYRGLDPERPARYTIKDIRPGRYKLRFGDASWYGGSSHSTATVVTAVEHSTTSVDFTAPPHGDLVGTVRSTRGTPVDDLLVTAYDPATGRPLAYAMTRQEPLGTGRGHFVLQDMPLKPVQILVSDAENRYQSRWFGGSTTRATADSVTPVKGQPTDVSVRVNDGLVALTAPTVSGKRTRGHTLTGRSGKWTISPSSYTRRWYRNGKPISGATRSTYRLTRNDVGKRISFGIVAHRSGHPAAPALSPETSPIR